jgi:RNA polymerase-binding transcription factor DksA
VAEDTGRLRSRLEADLAATATRCRELEADLTSVVDAARDVATDDEHDPEGATIAYERARITALINQADSDAAEIRLALQRIDAGTYGRCEQCGSAIAAERLDARPVARRCLSCANR